MDDVNFGHDMLQRAASTAEFPSTPELRAAVLRAIAAAPPDVRPRLAFGFAATAVIGVLAAGLAVPSSRDAVADFFGIEGSRIEILPTAPPGTTPTAFPEPSDIDQNAVPSSLEAASVLAGFEIALVDGNEPASVYTVGYGASTGVILRYETFDLWQVRTDGSFDGYFSKGVPPEATITDLMIARRPATWISGGQHFVQFLSAAGVSQPGTARSVERNTLIWRTDFALYRIETNLRLEDARVLAESLP